MNGARCSSELAFFALVALSSAVAACSRTAIGEGPPAEVSPSAGGGGTAPLCPDRLEPAGWQPKLEATWSKRFGAEGGKFGELYDRIAALAVDGAGDIVVVGTGHVDLGGGLLEGLFVGKLDGEGNHIWSRANDVSCCGSLQLAVDAAGAIVLAGSLKGTLDLGPGPLTSEQTSIFVVKLNADGGPLLSRSYPIDEDGTIVSGVATDAAGNIVLVGGQLIDKGNNEFGSGFITKLDAGGEPLWSIEVARLDNAKGKAPRLADVAVDPHGNVLVTGSFEGTIDLGGGPFESAGELDRTDVLVVKLSPAGEHLWSRRFGGIGNDEAHAIAADDDGNAVITGGYNALDGDDGIDFGGGPLLAYYSTGNTFVAKLDAAGEHLWSDRAPSSPHGSDWGVAVDIGPAGDVFVAGWFGYNRRDYILNLDGPMALYRYSPTGHRIWCQPFGGYSVPAAVATGPTGGAVLGGYFTGAVDLGNGLLEPAGYDPGSSNPPTDAFLAKFPP